MKIGIIAAMDEELRFLHQELTNSKIVRIGQFTFHSGQIRDVDVVVTQCGIGKVNAAVGATLLLENFKPDSLINIGVAGGFAQNIEIGDVVLSSEARHYDADATAFEYEIGQIPKMPAKYTADDALLHIAESVDMRSDNVAVHQGVILSGDAFVHTPSQIAYLAKKFPDALAVEMEGAAIAQTGFLFRVPFILIRAISDKIRESENQITYADSLHKAAKSSVKMTLGILETIHTRAA
ncbi:5'-methylthioadenosine/adenosylhomocysteine nucleosidase [Pseudodesulfovibrio sp. JC047]|uniref:5'-methylthioadenosine/adenosylhomocysteine nucleosidase n=1 Tax=Pseudodesulfovibrio sp. JC047 TaxID=2683199 RepID=UPI0013D31533|nr:5'-methylthioadenosine/adenosylhomocysteine nucleosidase [Pseudodesulfovibrio sp. JC047]